MFIRCTATRNRKSGEAYFTHRLVETRRVGNAVKQRTLLNLGSHFDLPQAEWPVLAARIEQLLRGQAALLPSSLSEAVEILAQRFAAQLIARQPEVTEATTTGATLKEAALRFQEVDLSTLEQVRPRTVGVEHVALASMRQLGFAEKLAALGFNKPQIAAAVGNVIGRMAAPASELATYVWLQRTTALGELIGYDYEGMDLSRLYRSADQLLKHRDALESALFGAAKTLFRFSETITLFDLTNTYFEGSAAGNAKATRGRSKEKRSDCPLVTLGLVLDSSGFVRRSRMFAGNAAEAATLQDMLKGLAVPDGALIIMDAGIATAANIAWLKEHKYRYLVVSRERGRKFDPELAVNTLTASNETIRLQRVLSEDGTEVRLYCHSEGRETKETAISARFVTRFEAGLEKLAAGLARPRGQKKLADIQQRIGRLKEKSRGIGQHSDITVTPDEAGKNATSITWSKNPVEGSMLTHPGVYCLRSN